MCMTLSGGGWNGALSLWKIGDLCTSLNTQIYVHTLFKGAAEHAMHVCHA